MSDEIREVETRIADQLAQFTSAAAVSRRTPAAYVRRHAIEHAVAGETLDERFVNSAFLPFVDAERLRSVPTSLWAGGDAGLRLLETWRQVAHWTTWDDHDLNQAALAYWGGIRRLESSNLPNRPVRVHWAQGTTGTSTDTNYRVGSSAVATATLNDGRVVVVTGSDDRTVRVWDLVTRAPLGEPLIGHTDRVWTVATAVLADGRVVAVTGSVDCTVRVWDLDSHLPLGEPLIGHTDRVRAVATAVLADGRVVAVTGGADRTVRVWDLATHAPLGEPLIGHTDRVRAVATATLADGRVVAVTGSVDRTVRVWDLDSHLPLGEPFTGHTGWVSAVATATLADGRVVAVTSSADGTVRVWDLENHLPLGEPLIGHTGWVRAVATARLADGRVVAVTGSDDRTVRVWDPDAMLCLFVVPTNDPVTAVALCAPRETRIDALLVSDGLVHVTFMIDSEERVSR